MSDESYFRFDHDDTMKCIYQCYPFILPEKRDFREERLDTEIILQNDSNTRKLAMVFWNIIHPHS